MIRVAYFVSHPIQYQAPLLRRISQESDIDLTVLFWSNHSIQGYKDSGFGGVDVKWDIPLLEGYKSVFLPALVPSSEITTFKPLNRGVYRALRDGNFDAVWLHGFWHINCWITLVVAKALGIPVMVRAEGTLIGHRESGLKKLFFAGLRGFVDAALAIGTRSRQYWRHYLGKDFPVFDVPYAVDNEYFIRTSLDAACAREQFRAEQGLSPGRPVILFASKLLARKRCIDLVDAFLGLESDLPYLLIVGDGEEREALERSVEESKNRDVRFLGFQNQSQLGRFFDLCDLFVLPSVDEPFGLVVNEVMNAGRPAVVSNQVGCQPDLIQDGVTGRVFPARDVAALRKVLGEMIADLDLCKQMGEWARERIREWSYEEDVQGLRRALKHVCAGRLDRMAESQR